MIAYTHMVYDYQQGSFHSDDTQLADNYIYMCYH